ncbi:MAG: Holliday junction branch migration DNA helicase RuvB [Planctomycetota bacterium]|nr:Holliday junction branch migration DNA helicase RuvB [Planctomycetota bacterium]MDA1105957.1 Holliday junction branch migration DNA helicase RuvB [Planctomycetota bacterium]
MARERLISATETEDEPTASVVASLRPERLEGYVGQRDLKERLSIALTAARERNEPLDHLLLHGPPGLGKTTLAHIVARELGTKAYVTSGPALTKASDLVGTLTRMESCDILFIDEIHRLPPVVEEYIYPAMEDGRIDFTVDSGMHARVVTLDLKPFTLIGATTRPGLLSQPLRDRFGLRHHLGYYAESELGEILARAAARLDIDLPRDALSALASRSRGTPRVALRLLRRVRDFSQVRASGRMGAGVVQEALDLEGVDVRGLDALDRQYMRVLGETYEGGPVGVEAIAASMGEDDGTLEDVVEPYLLQVGFLARTRQGRCLTRAGAEHIGVPFRERACAGDLFGG